MNTFFKLVGGIAVGVIMLGVLYGILHALLSFAVAGVFLFVFGVVCFLALVGAVALLRSFVGQSLPSSKLPVGKVRSVKRADKSVDQTLRELEQKIGPRP